MPLHETDIQELLSIAYVRAVSARAGFRASQPYPDRQHDDLQIDSCGKVVPDGFGGAKIDLQVKATFTVPATGDTFGFQIEAPLYNNLRDVERLTPLLLVVYVMPREPERWLTGDTDALVARHCGYWCNLRGFPPIESDSKVVRIKRRNILSVESLSALMTIVARRQEIGHEL